MFQQSYKQNYFDATNIFWKREIFSLSRQDVDKILERATTGCFVQFSAKIHNVFPKICARNWRANSNPALHYIIELITRKYLFYMATNLMNDWSGKVPFHSWLWNPENNKTSHSNRLKKHVGSLVEVKFGIAPKAKLHFIYFHVSFRPLLNRWRWRS